MTVEIKDIKFIRHYLNFPTILFTISITYFHIGIPNLVQKLCQFFICYLIENNYQHVSVAIKIRIEGYNYNRGIPLITKYVEILLPELIKEKCKTQLVIMHQDIEINQLIDRAIFQHVEGFACLNAIVSCQCQFSYQQNLPSWQVTEEEPV